MLATWFRRSPNEDLEGGTKDEMRIFEALFKGVSTQFGPISIEKCFEEPHFVFCSSFQNIRLGGVKFRHRMRFKSAFQLL